MPHFKAVRCLGNWGRFTWVNHIEQLWHKLHETITRNHQCRGMASLLARVKHFIDTVSPFPGNGYGTAKV
ncbi:hypothetical protein CF119_17190 [Aeromonas sobria]|nr:hypothetical protein CF119_17190 [Aeromonas sobria]